MNSKTFIRAAQRGAGTRSTTTCVHRGFTLVEMLAVLTILALLAGAAMQSTEHLLEQSQFESTQRSLLGLEEAVLGPENYRQPDGTPILTGFVADIGRLPLAAGADPLSQAAELWNNDIDDDNVPDLEPFDIKAAVSDPEILVPCGWRGPYVRLPVGATDLTDGWGKAYDLLMPDRTAVANGDTIGIIQSSAGNGYANNVEVIFHDTAAIPAVDRYHATISGRVWEFRGGRLRNPRPGRGPVRVTLFGPDPSTGGVLEQTITVTPVGGVYLYSFSNPAYIVTTGPRVIRGYQGIPTNRISDPIRLSVLPGGQAQDIVLRR